MAVREFYKFAAAEHFVDASVLAALYQVADDRHLPAHLSVEGAGLGYVARPRHRVKLARRAHRDVCAPEEFEGMLRAARNWRDRFLLVLLWFTGLRIGQALGLCREDLHLARSSRELGCVHQGAHLHVVWRENPNGARSKSRQENVIPVDDFVLLYFERYHALRATIRGAGENPLLFVNLAKNPGSGMTPGYADALFSAALRECRDPANSSAHVPARLRHQCPRWRCPVGRGAGIARASIHPLDADLQPHRSGRVAGCDRRRPGPVERAMTCPERMSWPGTAGPVGGDGTAPRRLVDLIDAEFLAGIGYDAGTQRITFPDDHPLLGPRYVPGHRVFRPGQDRSRRDLWELLRPLGAGPAGTGWRNSWRRRNPCEHRHRPAPSPPQSTSLGWSRAAGPGAGPDQPATRFRAGRAGGVILRMFSWIEDHHIDDLNDPAFLAPVTPRACGVSAAPLTKICSLPSPARKRRN